MQGYDFVDIIIDHLNKSILIWMGTPAIIS